MNEYNVRIDDEHLTSSWSDGDLIQHTYLNELETLVKNGINENYRDIQKMETGEINIGSSSKLDGASLSRYADEELQNSDSKVPTSMQVKQAIPTRFSDLNNDIDLVNKTQLDEKQDKLMSGVNIKTINGHDITGEGNIEISGGSGTITEINSDLYAQDMLTGAYIINTGSVTIWNAMQGEEDWVYNTKGTSIYVQSDDDKRLRELTVVSPESALKKYKGYYAQDGHFGNTYFEIKDEKKTFFVDLVHSAGTDVSVFNEAAKMYDNKEPFEILCNVSIDMGKFTHDGWGQEGYTYFDSWVSNWKDVYTMLNFTNALPFEPFGEFGSGYDIPLNLSYNGENAYCGGAIKLYGAWGNFTSWAYYSTSSISVGATVGSVSSLMWDAAKNFPNACKNYDETKTQVLKNINGTATWSDPDGGGNFTYLGDISQFSEYNNPLDLTNFEVGTYYLSTTNENPNLYIKFDYDDILAIDSPYLSNINANDFIVINIENKFDKTQPTQQIGTLSVNTFTEGWSYGSVGTDIVIINIYDKVLNLATHSVKTLNVLCTDKNQSIYGLHTYSTYLPESEIQPTQDNQLVNKKYVDEHSGGGSSFLGDFRDFDSAEKALDITNLDVGNYYISSTEWATGSLLIFYFKATKPDGTVDTKFVRIPAPAAGVSGVLKIKTKYTDYDPSSGVSFGTLNVTQFYKSMGSTNYKIGPFQILIRATTTGVLILDENDEGIRFAPAA